MRAPLLALLGLLVAATPALAARGSDRSPGGTAQRAKVAAAPAPSAGKPVRAAPARAAAAPHRKPTAQAARGGVRTAAAAAAARDRRLAYAAAASSTACRGGVRNCRLVRVVAPQPMRWSQGLSPALNVQGSNCPVGTMATLATGHTNVVRCMPI